MRWLPKPFRKRNRESQLDSELHFHIEQKTGDLIAQGVDPAEARRRAMAKFGGIESVKEDCRESRAFYWLESLFADIRYAVRMLRKSPGFTIVAILTLALGIGANVGIFNLIDSLILRPLPVRDPSRLVEMYTADRDRQWAGITVPEIEQIERAQSVFRGVFGRDYPNDSSVEISGQLWPINLGYVTGSYFSVLGVNPLLGRLIAPEDVGLSRGTPSAVAVLSHDFWKRVYGGNPDLIGKSILIAKQPFTIIGVAPKGFFGDEVGFSVDVYVPITEIPGRPANVQQALFCQYAFGRLRGGVSIEQARAQVESFWPAIRQATVPSGLTPSEREAFLAGRIRIKKVPVNGMSYLRDQFSKPLYVLMGISCLILLIACVSLATLLLARASARRHEMEIRIALGASRRRILGQLLTESVLLSVLGGGLGLGLALWASGWLAQFWSRIPFNPPTLIDLTPRAGVFAFLAGTAVFLGILLGLAPGWFASSKIRAGDLQGARHTSEREARRLGRLLNIFQVALSLTLVATGGLLVRSLRNLRSVRPGFDYRHVEVLQLKSYSGAYEKLGDNYYHGLVQRLSALPGVRTVSLSQMLPEAGFGGNESVRPTDARTEAVIASDFQIVSPEFFQTMGISYVRGRDFSWRDNAHTSRVAVISRSLAERLFPSEDPIGRDISVGANPQRRNVEVVGVVTDARIRDIRRSAPYTVYVPFLQEPEYIRYWTNVEILSMAPPVTTLHAARRCIDSLGHQFVFYSATLGQVINDAIANQRAAASASGFFDALTLLMAGISLFGLLAYSVTQRAREIGIRMALGAQPGSVLKMILKEGLSSTIAGIALGLPGALLGAHLVRHMLFGISPDDSSTLIGVTAVLLGVALLACWIPVRRAMRVDPNVALRQE